MGEYKDMVEAIQTGKSDLKDKKIIELAKKNRALQLSVESLKTKAAKAAEFALKLRSEKAEDGETTAKSNNVETIGGGGSVE